MSTTLTPLECKAVPRQGRPACCLCVHSATTDPYSFQINRLCQAEDVQHVIHVLDVVTVAVDQRGQIDVLDAGDRNRPQAGSWAEGGLPCTEAACNF